MCISLKVRLLLETLGRAEVQLQLDPAGPLQGRGEVRNIVHVRLQSTVPQVGKSSHLLRLLGTFSTRMLCMPSLAMTVQC